MAPTGPSLLDNKSAMSSMDSPVASLRYSRAPRNESRQCSVSWFVPFPTWWLGVGIAVSSPVFTGLPSPDFPAARHRRIVLAAPSRRHWHRVQGPLPKTDQIAQEIGNFIPLVIDSFHPISPGMTTASLPLTRGLQGSVIVLHLLLQYMHPPVIHHNGRQHLPLWLRWFC